MTEIKSVAHGKPVFLCRQKSECAPTVFDGRGCIGTEWTEGGLSCGFLYNYFLFR